MNSRSIAVLNAIALIAVAAVVIALISQHVFNMRPCAWCVLQRLLFLLIAAVCWLTVLSSRRWPSLLRPGAWLTALLGVCGALAAWYQYSVAALLFSCSQTFADRFMTQSGLDAGIPWLFGIFATCMDAKIELLGVEYALWGMALFILITISCVILALRKNRA